MHGIRTMSISLYVTRWRTTKYKRIIFSTNQWIRSNKTRNSYSIYFIPPFISSGPTFNLFKQEKKIMFVNSVKISRIYIKQVWMVSHIWYGMRIFYQAWIRGNKYEQDHTNICTCIRYQEPDNTCKTICTCSQHACMHMKGHG